MQIVDYNKERPKSHEKVEFVRNLDAIATIAFTSGTTHAPRGTLISN